MSCYFISAVRRSVWLDGVILFFVLSGYLITGILLDAKGSDGYFRNFYARRALRIFPAYYLTLLLTAVTIFIVAPASPALGPGAFEWTYFIFYVQNYWMGIEAYKTPLSGILGHTWTLAIEEQFYLIWPAAVFFLGRRALIGFCIALLVLSPIVRIWILQSTGNPALTLATLPGQCDALALGCADRRTRTHANRHAVDQRPRQHIFLSRHLPQAMVGIFGGSVFCPAFRNCRGHRLVRLRRRPAFGSTRPATLHSSPA